MRRNAMVAPDELKRDLAFRRRRIDRRIRHGALIDRFLGVAFLAFRKAGTFDSVLFVDLLGRFLFECRAPELALATHVWRHAFRVVAADKSFLGAAGFRRIAYLLDDLFANRRNEIE